MDRFFPNWLSLRTKIILPYMLLALLLAIGAAFIGTRIVFDSIEERFINQLIEAGRLSSEWMVREEGRLLETVRLVSHTEGIVENIQAQNAERLREMIYPIVVNSQEDGFEVLDTQGVALISMYHKNDGKVEEYEFSRGDDTLKQQTFVQAVLHGQVDAQGDKHAGIVRTRYGEYLYIASPISDTKNKLVGVALVAKSLNNLTRQMREATLSQVTLYAPTGVVLATTLLETQPLSRDITDNIITSQGKSYSRDATLSDIAYREVIGVWQVRRNTLGELGVAFAKNFLVRISQNTWLQILVSILTAFVLVLVIGLVASNRVSRPILRLEQAATQVADGNLQESVEAIGNDEVASLIRR